MANEELQKEAPITTTNAPTIPERRYKTGTKVAGFIFLVVALLFFALYAFCAMKFLFLPLMNAPEDLGEAIGVIFGYIFGIIYTVIFAILQLPANIVSIILFKRLRGRSDKNWENVLFTVLFILSLVILGVTLLSLATFIIITL